MHIGSRVTSSGAILNKRTSIMVALALGLASLSPAPIALAQGAFSPTPKGPPPAPAPVAPAPHTVTPNIPTPPPITAPALSNPISNQPGSNQPSDTKRSTDAETAGTTPVAPTGAEARGRRQYEPLLITKKNASDSIPLPAQSDGKGGFNFGKLSPGEYVVGFAGNTSVQQGSVLISLLLPAVQTAREAVLVEHQFPGTDREIKIAFRIGKDGRVMSLDWGDGKGPVNLAKETRTIPLPDGAQPGEIRATASSVSPTPANPTTGATAFRQYQPLLIRKRLPTGTPPLLMKTDDKGSFNFGKLEPGDYTLELSTKNLPGPTTSANPQGLETLIELLVVIALKTDGAVAITHDFSRVAADKGINIAFRMGKDGRVMSLDFGDGKGPVNLAKESKTIPLPKGAQPGEMRGDIFDRWGNL